MTEIGNIRERSPKQMAALAILIAMAMVLSFVEIPLIESAPWLKYDASGIIALLAMLIYGPLAGVAVAILAWVPHLVTNPLGAFMNIIASVVVVVVMWLIYRKKRSLPFAIGGALVGSACSIIVSIALNFLVMPIYLPLTFIDVANSILPALLPYNIAKLAINCAVALVAYRKLAALLAEKDEV
ncbi:MAG: ECF transporter S component [Raoultibacter sp.]